MELPNARRDKGGNSPPAKKGSAPVPVKEPEPPLGSIEDLWSPAAQMATVGIFVILLGACLYLCRPVLLPVVAAMVIGTTLAPIVKAGARHGVSPWVTAIALGAGLLVLGAPAHFGEPSEGVHALIVRGSVHGADVTVDHVVAGIDVGADRRPEIGKVAVVGDVYDRVDARDARNDGCRRRLVATRRERCAYHADGKERSELGSHWGNS